MTWSIALILILAAFIFTLISALGKCPVWVPLLLVCIALLLGYLPLHGGGPIK